ncbi:YkgJ family cysteine cluster protein [[Eubacterium] cellulosolvens]
MPRKSKSPRSKTSATSKKNGRGKRDKKDSSGKRKSEHPTDSQEEQQEEQQEVQESQDDEQGKRPRKFKFECQLCGKCCETETINITVSDLDRWVADNTIYRVFHLLKLDDNEGVPRIILKKDEDGVCNLYHRDNKRCTIYESRPLICQAFPLGFNGTNYHLKSTECIGLKKGEMTKEQLDAIRNSAFDEYIAIRLSDRVLPTLQRIIITSLLEQSKAFMDKLADADEEQGSQDVEKKTKDK